MFYRRFQKFMVAVLLLLHTSAASFAATVIYAQTIKGVIYKSTDSAMTWQAVGTPTLPNANGAGQMLAVDPQNTNNLYTVFATPGTRAQPGESGVNRSTDGGQSWTGTVFAKPFAAPLAVDATMSNIIYIVGGAGVSGSQPWRSTDYGATFQAATNPVLGDAIKTDPSQPGVVYLVGETKSTSGGNVPKGIYKSTDYGVTWALLIADSTVFGNPSGSIADLAVDPNNSSVLYVAAYSSACGTGTATTSAPPCGLIKSTDAGKTWQPVFADACGNVVVDPRNGNVYAGCYRAGTATVNPSGEVAKSIDGGKTFTKITTGLTRLGVEVHLDPESPNVLYGSQSRIVGVDTSSNALQPAGVFVSTDSGATWTLNKVDPTLQRPNDQVYSLVALTIKNPPPGVVAVPVITSLAPSSATAGGPDFTLAVTGAGFLSGAAVQWNGSPLSTTFSSDTQLSAAVPANLIAAVGSANIVVSNPDGTVSKAVSFAINPVGITISANGVVNGASQAGGAVSAGEIVKISGTGFGSSAQAVFDGVTAPRISAQAGQLTVVVPYEVNGNASTQLQVSDQGQSSSAVAIPVAAAAPGIFTADGSGSGQGLIFNEDGTANAPGNAAAAGSTVVVAATGEGQTDPPGVDGKTADAPAPVPLLTVTATVGGLDAMVVSAGGVPGMIAGYLQVSVQIPPDVTVGDSVAIVLHIGGIDSQGSVTLAIQ